jgi:enoyl-CoA hydratase/carnithine racemase
LDEALAIGLVSHQAPPGKTGEMLSRLVGELLDKPPEALRRTQQLLRHGTREEILDRMNLEGREFADRLASSEAQAAISAFFERRRERAS